MFSYNICSAAFLTTCSAFRIPEKSLPSKLGSFFLPDFFFAYLRKKAYTLVDFHPQKHTPYFIYVSIEKSHATNLQLVLSRNILDGEADSSHSVFAHADTGYCITKSQNIFYMFDSLFCNLGNVNHSLFARCKFNECTKFFDAYYFTSYNDSR